VEGPKYHFMVLWSGMCCLLPGPHRPFLTSKMTAKWLQLQEVYNPVFLSNKVDLKEPLESWCTWTKVWNQVNCNIFMVSLRINWYTTSGSIQQDYEWWDVTDYYRMWWCSTTVRCLVWYYKDGNCAQQKVWKPVPLQRINSSYAAVQCTLR